jgi:hypothetical protein
MSKVRHEVLFGEMSRHTYRNKVFEMDSLSVMHSHDVIDEAFPCGIEPWMRTLWVDAAIGLLSQVCLG